MNMMISYQELVRTFLSEHEIHNVVVYMDYKDEALSYTPFRLNLSQPAKLRRPNVLPCNKATCELAYISDRDHNL